ncbi:MAG: prephenate dehydrogenase [Chloroflexota bacterium]
MGSKPLSECSVAVVGLGLMGASLCMDLIKYGLCREVRGIARRTETVLQAYRSGAVDLATNDLHTGVLGADIVLLATPVRTIVSMLEEIGPLLWPGAVIMDMGSTKSEICCAMEKLPSTLQPIGGHPMTGKETAGFESAQADLYQGATWVLTPLERTSHEAVTLSTELVQAVRANPVVLPAERHDRLVASISHLPFLIASALVHAVDGVGVDDPRVWDLAAGGFRDTSRVAASDTRMFLDILMTNRGAILEQLDSFSQQVDGLRALLHESDEESLRQTLSKSKEMRTAWHKRNQ